MGNFRNILFLFPVMGYYLFEAVVAAGFISLAWRFFLEDFTGLHVGYLQWVALIWIIKVVFFDVFKLIAGFSSLPVKNNEVEVEEKQY